MKSRILTIFALTVMTTTSLSAGVIPGRWEKLDVLEPGSKIVLTSKAGDSMRYTFKRVFSISLNIPLGYSFDPGDLSNETSFPPCSLPCCCQKLPQWRPMFTAVNESLNPRRPNSSTRLTWHVSCFPSVSEENKT